MKKIFCFAAIMSLVNYASAQNSNPWPTTGNVGIGTTNPTTGKLVINTGVAAPASALDIRNSAGGAGNNPAITWGGGAYGFIDYNNNSAQGIRYSGLGPLVFGSNTNAAYGSSVFAEAMRITAAGNIGIGTIVPGATLSLGSSVQHNKLSLWETGFFQWGFGIQNQQMEQYFADDNPDNHISWGSMSHDGNRVFNEMMRFDISGRLSIGTTTPPTGYKLAVNGSVIATSVTVKLNSAWPDYVFKKGYKLPTLSNVKDYIDQNHHLPDMPSEKEVIDNGLNLGEMNKLLTKKIEELTLYLIEKEHEINELKASRLIERDAEKEEMKKMKSQLALINAKLGIH